MSQVMNPKEVAASLKEFWSLRIIDEVDDSYIKVAKVKGTLVWHSHENEDEVFQQAYERIILNFFFPLIR